MRALGCVPLMLLAVTGCAQLGPGGDERPARYPAAAPASYAAAPASYAPEGYAPETPYAGEPAAPRGQASSGEAAGIAYIERTTAGANPNDPLPMIVALHSRGGSQDQFARIFANFPVRARLIVPHGAIRSGGRGYRWWEAKLGRNAPEEYGADVRPVEAQMSAAIAQLRATRPTIGRPIVCGFSQGASLSWALALAHPEHVSAAFPFAGQIPAGFSPGTWTSPWRPEIHAFDGVRDPGNARTRASVEEARRMGLQADLKEYPIGHQLEATEVRDALERMAAILQRPGGP